MNQLIDQRVKDKNIDKVQKLGLYENVDVDIYDKQLYTPMSIEEKALIKGMEIGSQRSDLELIQKIDLIDEPT